jgi:hypothetical protein
MKKSVGYQNRTIEQFANLIQSKTRDMRWYGKQLNALYVNIFKFIMTQVSSSNSSRLKRAWVITKNVEISAAPEQEHISYNPTKSACPHFTGREEYLRALVSFFSPRGKDDIPSRREFLLYGIGGAGKTQICLKFAEQYSRMYEFVIET